MSRFPALKPLTALLVLTAVRGLAEGLDPGYTRETTIDAKQKIRHKWRPRNSVVLTDLLENGLPPDPRSRYGGLRSSKTRATGFFRTQRDPAGRWWLIDPEGHPFLSVGLNAVRHNQTDRGEETLRSIWGGVENWADRASALLRAHGFNTLGAWSDFKVLRESDPPIPHTDALNFMSRFGMKIGKTRQGTGHIDYPDDLIHVFHPDFESFCREEARKLEKLKDDPWVLGYFSDNEMPFPEDALDRFLDRPSTAPGHKAAREWMASNRVNPDRITDRARARFLYFMAERYYRICAEAIRASDPNHLYLGTRFHARVLWSEPVVRAAGKHVDVMSVNWYAQWTPDEKTMDKWVAWTGKPFLITEFYAKGLDTGLPNTSGAGWVVKTQKDRAAFYQNFALPLLGHPGCVGWHWFRYMDNDPEDIPFDPTNRDANKGIVDGTFEPYPNLLEAMELLNERVYRLRLLGATPPDEAATRPE